MSKVSGFFSIVLLIVWLVLYYQSVIELAITLDKVTSLQVELSISQDKNELYERELRNFLNNEIL